MANYVAHHRRPGQPCQTDGRSVRRHPPRHHRQQIDGATSNGGRGRTVASKAKVISFEMPDRAEGDGGQLMQSGLLTRSRSRVSGA